MVRTKQNNPRGGKRSQDYNGGSQESDYDVPSFGNIESEAILLGILLREVGTFFQFHSFLDETDFVEQSHKVIFLSLESLYLQGIEKITPIKIVAEARQLGLDPADELQEVVSSLIVHPTTPEEAPHHFAALKKETIRRSYLTDCSELFEYLNDTNDTTASIIRNVEERILGKAQSVASDRTGLRDITGEAWDIVKELADDPGAMGLDVGFPHWQTHIGQLRNGTLHMIAATTGAGKSLFGVASAIHIARSYRIPVLICDSELNQRDQTVRMYGIFYKIPFWVIETGYWKLSEDELKTKDLSKDQIDQALDAARKLNDESLRKEFASLPITYKTINEMSVLDSTPFMRQWFAQKVKKKAGTSKVPNAFIIYDYLKLNTVGELRQGSVAIQEYQSLGLNCAALHNFAQEYCLPIMTFGQTNREIDDNLNCIAGSKRLAELCDSVSLLREKTPDNRIADPDGNYMFRIFKSRYGKKTGGSHVNVEFLGETGSFKEIGMGTLTRANSSNDDDDEEDDE